MPHLASARRSWDDGMLYGLSDENESMSLMPVSHVDVHAYNALYFPIHTHPRCQIFLIMLANYATAYTLLLFILSRLYQQEMYRGISED